MYWFPFFEKNAAGEWVAKSVAHLRILGVLQRIAIAYFFAALLAYYFKPKTLVLLSALILLLYYPIMLYCGYPSKDPLSMYGNVILRFDTFTLGQNHLYQDDGESHPFGPEGFVSTIPSLSMS